MSRRKWKVKAAESKPIEEQLISLFSEIGSSAADKIFTYVRGAMSEF